MGTTDAPPPALVVQVVLYNTPPRVLERTLRALGAAVRVAGPRLGAVTLLVGDCTERPSCADGGAELDDRARAAGLDGARYHFFDANLGSAEGNNRLLTDGDRAAADADLVLLLNPDTVLGPAALAELVDALADPRVGAVEARQVPLEHPKPYDVSTGATSWVTMACLLVRREVVRRVGLLDSATFFLYCDDVDYSWRIRLAGWTLCHRPRAVVFHDKRISPEGYYVASEVMQFSSAEGALLLAHKYGRPDAFERLRADFAAGNDQERRAVEVVDGRIATGTVPEPLAGGPDVADFMGRAFSEHRF